jgi:hypothetical protein
MVFKKGDRAVFVHLFPKGSKANLTTSEERVYRAAAKVLAGLDDAKVAALVATGEWIEIKDDDDE